MKAYNNDSGLKDMLIEEAIKHRELDRLRQDFGYGKVDENGNFKGCNIGCTIFSLNSRLGTKFDYNSHLAVAKTLDLPVQLVWLFDRLFEHQPPAEAMTWQERHWRAIPVGSDQTQTVDKFLHWLLMDPAEGVIKFVRDDKQRQSTQAVADHIAKKLSGETVTSEEWSTLRIDAWGCWRFASASAYASASAATYAASAAAYAASAYASAYAYTDAADAAYAYADAHADAHADAAYAYAHRRDTFVKQGVKLLELMSAAPRNNL